jgi:hypothetical protein
MQGIERYTKLGKCQQNEYQEIIGHKIYPLRFSCLSATYVLIATRHTHLVVHALIGITRLALHMGTVRTNHKRGYTSHTQFTGVAFCGSRRE